MSTELERSADYALARGVRDEGRRTLNRGAIVLGTLPAVAFLAIVFGMSTSSLPVTLMLLIVYSIGAGAWGVVMTAMGLLQTRSATKRLAELDGNGLPEARLLR